MCCVTYVFVHASVCVRVCVLEIRPFQYPYLTSSNPPLPLSGSLNTHAIEQVTGRKDIDAENFAGDNALTLACARHNRIMIEILLQAGADINHETKTGRTPLIEATKALPDDRSGNHPVL